MPASLILIPSQSNAPEYFRLKTLPRLRSTEIFPFREQNKRTDGTSTGMLGEAHMYYHCLPKMDPSITSKAGQLHSNVPMISSLYSHARYNGLLTKSRYYEVFQLAVFCEKCYHLIRVKKKCFFRESIRRETYITKGFFQVESIADSKNQPVGNKIGNT